MRALVEERPEMASIVSKEIISNMLLGIYPGMRSLLSEELASQVARGFFHAVGVAVKLASLMGKMVMISVLREGMSGVAILAGGPGNSGVHACRIDLGIPMECDEASVIKGWPEKGKIEIVVVEG